MATSAVEKTVPVAQESKSARKKKADRQAGEVTATNGHQQAVAVPSDLVKEDSSVDGRVDPDASSEHAHVKELQKQIRSITKKLGGMQKIDAVIAEHPHVSLDELVAQRKINADQKAAALKKPQLNAQLAQLEDQIQIYRSFDADYKQQLTKQRQDLTAQHQKDLERAKEELRLQGVTLGASELREKLLVFSQFLRAAAAKRTIEEEAGTTENLAFEGALLLVYGGDQKAVDTAISIIDGTDESVPSIDGVPQNVKYSQIKQASIDHAPYQAEEEWAEQVAQATGNGEHSANPSGSDPTVAHAGLTELDAQPNGLATGGAHEPTPSHVQGTTGDEAGNLAGERWDTSAGVEGERGGLEDSYEIIARPNDEVDTPADAVAASAPHDKIASWADEAAAQEAPPPTGNQAGESWAAESGPADGAPAADADGFQQIHGRHRGRGGRARGDGEFRGRGGRGGRGHRGDGEFRGGRGRGRGEYRGRGDGEYRGRGDGEYRGRGDGERGYRGRGRGPRGDGPPRA